MVFGQKIGKRFAKHWGARTHPIQKNSWVRHFPYDVRAAGLGQSDVREELAIISRGPKLLVKGPATAAPGRALPQPRAILRDLLQNRAEGRCSHAFRARQLSQPRALIRDRRDLFFPRGDLGQKRLRGSRASVCLVPLRAPRRRLRH